MTIDQKISELRTECEILFYDFSTFLNKNDSEKAAKIVLEYELKKELNFHKEFLNSNEILTEKVKEKKMKNRDVYDQFYDAGFEEGSLSIISVRTNTHQIEIEKLKDKLDLIKFL